MITKKIYALLIHLCAIGGLIACATPANHYDPLESVNRLTFAFNDKLDRYAVKPVAQVYADYVPAPAQQGVTNFVGNIGDVNSIIGNVMEGEFKNATKDMGRVLINTVFGMFGLVDWASDMGLEKQERGIGKALGRWGIGTGPYLVLPFLGPLTVRDSADPIFNWTVGVPAHFNTHKGEYSYLVIGGIGVRASLLPYERALEDQLIFDKYAYIRDSYLQKRYNDVYRGNPPTPFVLGEPMTEEDNLPETIMVDNTTASAQLHNLTNKQL
jgi:phospholipid-binding lipoprotein MlaA